MTISSVAIIGAGPIGSILAASLASRGVEVSILGRERDVSVIRTQGITVTEPDGASWNATGITASTAMEDIAKRPCDLAVFAVKTFDTAGALQQWVAAGGQLERAVSLQNTTSNEAILAESFRSVGSGVVRFGGTSDGPGRPRVFSFRGERDLDLGMFTSSDARWIEEFRNVLVRSGILAQIVEDIDAVKFAKLVMNLDNALCAASNTPMNHLSTPVAVKIRTRVRVEALEIAERMGMRELPLAPIREAPVPSTGPRVFSSTWFDLDRGRGRTETPWLNGRIVELGKEYAISTPANAALTELIAEMAAAGRAPGAHSLDEVSDRVDRASASASSAPEGS
ncbi:ketopantoate reductase family protein [Microbacterium sp.]|uniref:ketopantoate reductase family protein n=1 Tax=Microbacterium sp. TaxID=51671 RepID=UPI003C74BFE5